MNYIYGLIDPRTSELRYVGKSTNPKQRIYFHIKEAKDRMGSPTHKEAWIKQLLVLGLQPELEILEDNIRERDWAEIEKWWIYMARACGHNLVNTTEGGNGFGSGANHYAYGGNFSSIHKENLSKSKMGINNPMYGKVGGNKGKRFTESHRRNLSKAHVGYVPSPESLEKKRVAMLGKKNHQYGKVRSEVERKRVSDANKGREQSSNHQKKKSLSMLMMFAQRNGDIAKIHLLQEQYLELSGKYNKKYSYESKTSSQ